MHAFLATLRGESFRNAKLCAPSLQPYTAPMPASPCTSLLLQTPGLAVVLVGERKDSETYVRNKKKACEEAGIRSFGTDLTEDTSQEDLLQVVADYNANPEVNGILVQLPLPKHINETVILDAIDADKDVDGFHPETIGHLAMRGRTPKAVACTPKGCMLLLERSGVQIAVCLWSGSIDAACMTCCCSTSKRVLTCTSHARTAA